MVLSQTCVCTGSVIVMSRSVHRDQQKTSESKIPSDQSAQSHQTHLNSIFSVVEQNIMTFIKKELKRFKTKLSSDLPEGFEGQRKDEEMVDSEDGKQESSAKEGALKITVHFLRNMNQDQLADILEEKLDLSYNHPGDSGVTLLSAGLEDPTWRLEKLSVDHGGEWRLKSGLKKYVCDLTLDPNTVNRNLCLSEENRKVTWRIEEQPYPDHPERFEDSKQVLCREGLTGRSYWEVEWTGEQAYIAVTYKGINRRGAGVDCGLGYNDKSWSLYYDGKSYSVCHNNISTGIHVTSLRFHRVGVYLDWPAGTLSFYRVSSDTLTHLYTFNTTFTEPLYPGFWVHNDSSVSLCQVV
ncbi:hypothetical protein UPYG_G00095770 [Umbra pygmaea]|uniref:B30.2/SPRY domain-containing protein n=1 Tax=Umbra pygmaea TaxID=75934 RepID=A0ABD0X3S7_UMBPY